MNKNTVVFFVFKEAKQKIELTGYYKQDIDALKSIYNNVIIINNPFKLFFVKYDKIFIWWWSYALLPILISKIKGSKSYVTGTFNFKFNTTKAGRDYFHRPIHQRIIIKMSLLLADKNLFVNQDEFNRIKVFFGIDNAVYYPHAVDTSVYNDQKKNRKFTLLNISWSGLSNLQRKGVFDILEAMVVLKSKGYDVDLTLAGMKGDGFEYLKKRIFSMGLSDKVKLLANIDEEEKIELMRTTKIYIQPSYFEGFGLAVAEAMACGMSIICTKVGGMTDLVSDVGITVEPGNITNIVSQICFLIDNPNLQEEFRDLSINRIQKNYSFQFKKSLLNKIFK
jgi:glycosyltransferase involved in cell wall biosynthesis